MKTIRLLITLSLLLGSSKSHASILDFKQILIDFTKSTEAQAKAMWSDPDKITISEKGLGWDGEAASSRDGWILTKPIALGFSWRPTYAISVRASIDPAPREFSLANGQKSTGDAGDVYVRYSPDLKHWSSWQVLQRDKAQSDEEKKKPASYYSGSIRVPYRDRNEYSQLISDYMELDVPWKSDEEAAVKWILNRDPEFFGKHIPFIGYAEFLFEGSFRGGQRIQSLRVDISYGMGGMHSPPKDASVYKEREIPWRFEGK